MTTTPSDDEGLREEVRKIARWGDYEENGEWHYGIANLDEIMALFSQKIIEAKAKRERVTEALKDIIVHAAPDGTQDDGDFIGFYILPTGPIHRGIVALQSVGEAREPMGDVSVISRYQARLATLTTKQDIKETTDE